ncbi:ABC transporter ATP-binding protein [Cellulosimicrobium arenosum]|uniref:ABC transporter ATP-binding protein n=1 Tax=Cellulosimicrobium arenosum TaxID=2708133 RepID=A0A927GB07_9MICO|nr:ABC transporter ATP-binding protein [Cellulosimicrobium arenosum]MBD8079429.1 ABC transporter ATP-binding protein [Cellulosimicrobium arenosum]
MWGARDVTVRFDGGHGAAPALDAVTVSLPRGEVTALVGGDGAGKTTLLRALVRRVALAGGSVDVPSVERVGFQPATSGVWRTLSVAENVEFVGAAYSMGRKSLTARADELLGRAGLDGARDRLGGQLSGGMRQKLGFCLAMLHEPDLLLLDEPSTGVDPVSRVELWRLVAEAAAAGTAIALATTYLDEAERAATVVALDAGRVLAAADPPGVVAAVPGQVTVSDRRPDGDDPGPADVPPGSDDGPSLPLAARTWRRGTAFHTWTPPGTDAPPGEKVVPDLEDALVVLSLAGASS